MRCCATPGEVQRWHEQLAPHMPADRVVAVIRLLADVVTDCPVCDEAVRRCDPRVLHGGELLHLRCAGGGVER
jgi:hypothetical protein